MNAVTVVMTLMTAFVLLAPIGMAVVLVLGGVRREGTPALAAVPASAADRDVELPQAA